MMTRREKPSPSPPLIDWMTCIVCRLITWVCIHSTVLWLFDICLSVQVFLCISTICSNSYRLCCACVTRGEYGIMLYRHISVIDKNVADMLITQSVIWFIFCMRIWGTRTINHEIFGSVFLLSYFSKKCRLQNVTSHFKSVCALPGKCGKCGRK